MPTATRARLKLNSCVRRSLINWISSKQVQTSRRRLLAENHLAHTLPNPHSARKQKYMQGLHGSGDQYRSEAWMTGMRARKGIKVSDSVTKKREAVDAELNKKVVKYGDEDKVQKAFEVQKSIRDKTKMHKNWVSPQGGCNIANDIATANVNFAQVGTLRDLNRKTVARTVARVARILIRKMLSIVQLCLASLCIVADTFLPEPNRDIVIESFCWGEAQQWCLGENGDVAEQSCLRQDGALGVFTGKSVGMELLKRSLHLSCIILGNINAEAVMDLLNAIAFVGGF